MFIQKHTGALQSCFLGVHIRRPNKVLVCVSHLITGRWFLICRRVLSACVPILNQVFFEKLAAVSLGLRNLTALTQDPVSSSLNWKRTNLELNGA